MQSILATIICFIFILFLFWKDSKKSDMTSKTLWIPYIWMFLAGSRYVSAWLGVRRSIDLADAYQEGSLIDAVTFFLLIIAGIYILIKRNINWGRLLGQNKLIWFYFIYCGISIFWADYAFVSFKRYFKELGNVIMVLVILTETHPYESIALILRRLSYLLLPLSVLFVKYYPEIGRAYHMGMPMFIGVTNQKNVLGQLCLIAGIYLSWENILNRKKDDKLVKMDSIPDYILIGMVIWLLYKSDSATSIICLVVAVIVLYMSSMRVIAKRPGRIINLMIISVCLGLVLDATLDIKTIIIETLGRRPDLTTRVPMWQMLKEMVVNPIFGAGYMSFWSGDRFKIILANLGTEINNAHNGYLEQYLNLGYIGVAFIGLIILSGLMNVRRYLRHDYSFCILRLCFIVTAVINNYTEASFFGINNLWILLLAVTIDMTHLQGSNLKVINNIYITEGNKRLT